MDIFKIFRVNRDKDDVEDYKIGYHCVVCKAPATHMGMMHTPYCDDHAPENALEIRYSTGGDVNTIAWARRNGLKVHNDWETQQVVSNE